MQTKDSMHCGMLIRPTLFLLPSVTHVFAALATDLKPLVTIANLSIPIIPHWNVRDRLLRWLFVAPTARAP